MKTTIRYLLICISSLLISCTTTQTYTANSQITPDLYESVNRDTNRLNDTLDKTFLEPLAKGYKTVIPWNFRRVITHFFDNVTLPATLFNDLLQGRVQWALNDFWRLTINTTAGVGGLFDVASDVGLNHHTNTFGLTLTTWGVPNTSYLVLPFYGPSTVTDAIALIPDFFVSPWNYVFKPAWLQYSLYAVKVVNSRSNLINAQNIAQQLSLDNYLFLRNAYLQYRQNLQYRNENPTIDQTNNSIQESE